MEKLERWLVDPAGCGSRIKQFKEQRRYYIIDADEEDGKRCETCGHAKLLHFGDGLGTSADGRYCVDLCFVDPESESSVRIDPDFCCSHWSKKKD